jgi:hypothetical protein
MNSLTTMLGLSNHGKDGMSNNSVTSKSNYQYDSDYDKDDYESDDDKFQDIRIEMKGTGHNLVKFNIFYSDPSFLHHIFE